eukprot:117819_1
MGSCNSTGTPKSRGSPQDRQQSVLITKELRNDKDDVCKIKKILFLGSGGAGKSTLFKQLKQIHGQGFSEEDKREFRGHIHNQIISQMKAALQIYIDWHHLNEQKERKLDDDDEYDELSFFDDHDLILESPPMSEESMKGADALMSYKYNRTTGQLDADIAAFIQLLWREPVIREIYNKRNVTRIETSSAHFWDQIDVMSEGRYLPTHDDIMLCRLVTVGLHEMSFTIHNDTFNVIDVGGQRSQRRKWIHCFEYVVAVIFVSSLAVYDEVLHEDVSVNAMEDQLSLFGDICNDQMLSNTAMILFLNKKDLFAHKHCVNQIPLNACPLFADYDANCFDYDEGVTYISNAFSGLNKTPETSEIFCHVTRATDTNNVEKVFADVQLVVVSAALSEGGYTE